MEDNDNKKGRLPRLKRPGDSRDPRFLETAEACAEWLHQQVRKDYWCYAKDETLDNEALIKEQYTGIRPAPGYPACPDHTE